MANNRNAVRAGIFMLLSVAAAIAIIIAIAGGAAFTLRYDTHRVAFKLSDNLNGLRKGDDVRLGGLRVGTISEIKFVPRDSESAGKPADDQIVVWFSTPAEYVIKENAKVGIESSLTGVTSLNISDLGAGSAVPPEVALIGMPDSLTSIKASILGIVPKVRENLDTIHATLEKGQATLDTGRSALETYRQLGTHIDADWPKIRDAVLDRVKQVVDSANRALDAVHDFLGPASGDFHQSMTNVRDITASVKDKLPPIEVSIKEALDKVNNTLGHLQGSVGDVKEAIANAKELSGSLRSVIDHNQARLNDIVAGVDKTTNNAAGFLEELKVNPWRLIYRPTGDLAANQNLFEAARQFAEGANSLDDAAAMLRDELKDPHADPAKVQKLYDNLQDQFNKFHETEDDLWKKVKE